MDSPPRRLPEKGATPKPSANDNPSEFSWKNYLDKDWTTSARNQGNCGSCWDFAAIGALESIINIREGYADLDPDLSEQYVLSCLPSAGSCGGGSPYYTYKYIYEETAKGNNVNGVVFESCFPYEADDTVPCSDKCGNWMEYLLPLDDYGYWHPDGSQSDIEAIKTQVMTHGPVVTFINANEEFKNWGLFNHNPLDYYPYQESYSINHCVVIVGWKEDSNIENGGYWICKNSWGNFWGYNGFFNIEYNSLGIDDYQIVWADYDKSNYDFSPVAKLGGPYNTQINTHIEFDASNSFDCEGDIISYNWDFGDGNNGSGVNPTHKYSQRGIYVVELTVIDEIGNKDTGKTWVAVDLWNKEDRWVYSVDKIEVNVNELGQKINFQGSIDELIIKVKEETEKEYILQLDGKTKGDFKTTIYSNGLNYNLSGVITGLTRINGEIKVIKNGLKIKELNAYIPGLILLTENPLKIPIPIPITGRIYFNSNFQIPVDIINPILEKDQEWNVYAQSISANVQIKSIFIFILSLMSSSIPSNIDINEKIDLPTFQITYNGKEQVQTPAGVFNTDRYCLYDTFNYYFSSDIGNVVLINGELYGYVNLSAQLTSYNYPI